MVEITGEEVGILILIGSGERNVKEIAAESTREMNLKELKETLTNMHFNEFVSVCGRELWNGGPLAAYYKVTEEGKRAMINFNEEVGGLIRALF